MNNRMVIGVITCTSLSLKEEVKFRKDITEFAGNLRKKHNVYVRIRKVDSDNELPDEAEDINDETD